MTDASIKSGFDGKAAAPSLMSPEIYRDLLTQLVTQGAGYGKTESVGAFLLRDLQIVTETSSGEVETSKTIKVENLYVLMDMKQYPLEAVRQLVIKDIAANWAGKVIGERELNDPDLKAAGIWVNKPGAVEFDYLKSEDRRNSEFKPNPAAYRVCLTMGQTVIIPVQWGDFKIEAGGVAAIRERDIADVVKALQSINSGEATIEEALYAKDKDGKTVAKYDIYGMEPGFLEKQYNAVPLKAETVAAAATLSVKKPDKQPARKA